MFLLSKHLLKPQFSDGQGIGSVSLGVSQVASWGRLKQALFSWRPWPLGVGFVMKSTTGTTSSQRVTDPMRSSPEVAAIYPCWCQPGGSDSTLLIWIGDSQEYPWSGNAMNNSPVDWLLRYVIELPGLLGTIERSIWDYNWCILVLLTIVILYNQDYSYYWLLLYKWSLCMC